MQKNIGFLLDIIDELRKKNTEGVAFVGWQWS